MNHSTFSRKGGKARSEAKTAANRAKSRAYWSAVRSGERPAPYRPRVPPDVESISKLLGPLCSRMGITLLEAFGSIVSGEARRGSDVDLMATFSSNPGLKFFTMEEEMASALGVPVHLLTRDSVEQMTNPYRRKSILADARVIYNVESAS